MYLQNLKDFFSDDTEEPSQNKNYGAVTELSTNFSQITLRWIELPVESGTLYGGLQYNNKNNTFIYSTQSGVFYEIDKFNVERGNKLNIPDFKVKQSPENGSFWDLDYDRLGVRDFVLDTKNNVAVIAVSELDVERSCHQISVYSYDLQVKKDKWSKIFTTDCWDVGIGDSIGGGLANIKRKVYLTIGTNSRFTGVDFFSNHQDVIQENGLGRVIEINLDTNKTQVYATGFRNSQGITVTPADQIFTVEHGPQGGDELNLVNQGEDYGFPQLTLGVNYGDTEWPFLNPELGQKKSSVPPIFSWVPSIAPSDIEYNSFYKGISGLTDCELVIPTLREESLYFVRLRNGCRDLVNIEKLYIGERIRKLAINPVDKTFLVTTDGDKEIGYISFN